MRGEGSGREHDWVRLRCVIVDDDEAFLDVAQVLLEQEQVTVAGVARNGAEAVERTRTLRPDVVLIDIRLGLIMISTHGGADYAGLIDESPVAGFLAKTDLSAAGIRDILAAG